MRPLIGIESSKTMPKEKHREALTHPSHESRFGANK